MCSSTQDLTVVHNNKIYLYTLKLTDETHGGFMWTVYDPDGAYLYAENYDPDQINPADEAHMFATEHCESNY